MKTGNAIWGTQYPMQISVNKLNFYMISCHNSYNKDPKRQHMSVGQICSGY